MSAAKIKSVSIKSVGTTVWDGFEARADAIDPKRKRALADKLPAKSVAAEKAPAKRASGPVAVTVFDTPLRPRHTTRAILSAAARSVK